MNTDENKKNIDLYIKAQLFNNQEAILPIQTARLKLVFLKKEKKTYEIF